MAHYAQSEEDMDEEGNIDWATYYQGKRMICSEVLNIISSLQQEQSEVDLEKDIEKLCNFDKSQTTITMTKGAFKIAAHHFYELGLNTRKEK